MLLQVPWALKKKNTENELVLYPNPVSNVLNIKNPNGMLLKSLKITDFLGKTVYLETHAEGKNAIDVSNLSSGMYLLSISIGDKIQQSKFYKK